MGLLPAASHLECLRQCAWRERRGNSFAYPDYMASIPLTLAALATSAVPGLEVLSVESRRGGSAYATAVLSTDRGDVIARVPRNSAAEVRQSAELLGLAALSEGSRALLPFAVPHTLGMTRAGETRAVFSTFLPGSAFQTEDLQADAFLMSGIASMLAAVHDLPISVAQHGGLPVRSNRELNEQARRLVDRAEATRLLPSTVRESWDRVLGTSELWDFSPTMVHGALDSDQLLVIDDEVTGVLGWHELSVGDPAVDFAWLLDADSEVLDAIIPRYGKLRSAGSLTALRARARLYHELEVAKWLLHGVDSHDQAVIDDAVAIFDRLVDSLARSAPVSPRGALNEHEVVALLEETPEVTDHLSDTAAYEALDEDRMFGVDRAFMTAPEEHSDASDRHDFPDGNADDVSIDRDHAAVTTTATGGAITGAGAAHNTDDQVTAAIADDELPPRPPREALHPKEQSRPARRKTIPSFLMPREAEPTLDERGSAPHGGFAGADNSEHVTEPIRDEDLPRSD